MGRGIAREGLGRRSILNVYLQRPCLQFPSQGFTVGILLLLQCISGVYICGSSLPVCSLTAAVFSN